MGFGEADLGRSLEAADGRSGTARSSLKRALLAQICGRSGTAARSSLKRALLADLRQIWDGCSLELLELLERALCQLERAAGAAARAGRATRAAARSSSSSSSSSCSLELQLQLAELLEQQLQLSRLLKLLEELTDRDFWLDGCYRVLLYSVRFNHLSAAVDLLKQLKDRISNDEMAMEAIFDEVFFSIAEETTLLQMGFDLLQVIMNDLGLAPSRKVLDVLLSACVSTKDMDKSILIWKEYQAADLPYNILSFLRMYQALLASGDLKSARIVLSKMPKDDPHVRLIIQESQTVYAKMASEKKTEKNRKTKGIKHKKSKAKK